VVQQLAMMAALAVTAASVIAHVDIPGTVAGLGVSGVGLIWALLGWGGVLRPLRLLSRLGPRRRLSGR
jgi:hypothetical protein